MLIRLTTLGAVRVHRDQAEITDLPAQRLRFALLLYLAVERDVSREEVVGMFWPERDTARGKHALRQMLYELRQVLGDDWVELRRDRILTNVAVDATEFEDVVSAGRTDEALRLYGGPFLLGFSLENRSFEGWADRRQSHLGRLHRRVQREHIAQLVADGRMEDAIAAARRWVELDPLEDEAAHTLIERLAAAGQRTAALQYYDNYERQLESELHVEPLEETTALVAAIRTGAVVQPTGVAPTRSTHDTPVQLPAVSAAPALPPAVIPRAAARTVRGIWRSTPVRRRAAAAAMLAPVVILIVLIARPPARRAVAADGTVSIAVLPFNDHSPEGSLGPLTNELTETLAHSLAQSRFLKIITPNGVLLLRSQGTPEDSLGRLLGADYLVGGSVRRDADHVRVDIELLDGRSGIVVRTEVVDRPWAESRILVEDVVRGAAMFLRREVGAQIEIERGGGNTSSEEAFRLVLEAKSIQMPITALLKAGQFTEAERSLVRADSVLAIAAGLDRRWAEPVVLRGWTLERRAFVARAATPADASVRRELLVSGLRMADLASERDPGSAKVHALRGAVLHQLALLGGQPIDTVNSLLAEAEVELRRATDLDPLSQTSWRRLTDLLTSTGRYGEAKLTAERAYRLDPYAPEANALMNLLFTTSFEIGEDDQAEGWCLAGRQRFPDELPFLYCLLALHAWADGIESDPVVLRRAMETFREGELLRFQPLVARLESMVAAAHARAGQPDSARAVLRRVANASDDPALLWMRAGAHAALGEDSTAIALLAAFLERGPWEAQRVARSRPFWRLRDHPEVKRLLEPTPPNR